MTKLEKSGPGRGSPLKEVEEKQEERGRKPRRRGRVTVFDNWCKGCGICVAFCPQGVFESRLDGHIIIAHEERCTACQWCDYHCPDFAILIEPIDDGLAVDEPHAEEK